MQRLAWKWWPNSQGLILREGGEGQVTELSRGCVCRRAGGAEGPWEGVSELQGLFPEAGLGSGN